MMPLIARIAAAVAILVWLLVATTTGLLVEEECPSEEAVIKRCTLMEWSCDNKCHPLKNVRCNGSPQCGDRSDEMNCPNCNKTARLFQCDDGECLAEKYRCDGRHHCFDGTDEKNCKDIKNPCDDDDELPCGSAWKCYPKEKKCAGRRYCINSADQVCGGKCKQQSKFNCSNGDCGFVKCDQMRHCMDASDENDCSDDCKESWKRLCKDGKQCIYKSWWCDGFVHCTDESDENNCSCSGRFKCHDNSSCIPMGWLCDGISHCFGDHSDERHCTGKGQCDSYNHIRCSDGECIRANYPCNGRVDCKDHSDEMGCGKKCSFKRGLFFCKNGECTTERCDGKKDCLDGTDEENCHQK